MESKFDLIEKYLNNEMTVREETEFEDLLRSDPELMKEFKLRKQINEAILEDDIINLRDKLNNVLNPGKRKLQLSRNPFLFYSAAAVIIVLLIISALYISPMIFDRQEDLVQTFYKPYPAIMSFRSPVDRTTQEQLLYKAFNLYDDHKFADAAEYFTQVLKNDTSNNLAQFYLAICTIETGKYNDSEEYLIDLTQRNNHIFWEQSYWYLAMVYLKKQDTLNAELTLKKIVKEKMTGYNDAQKILNSLN